MLNLFPKIVPFIR